MKIHHVAASLGLLVSFTYVGACAVESPDQTEETDQSSSDALKACHHASDCKGALPQLCEQCSDGTSECALGVRESQMRRHDLPEAGAGVRDRLGLPRHPPANL
jgi:hypothetical protein